MLTCCCLDSCLWFTVDFWQEIFKQTTDSKDDFIKTCSSSAPNLAVNKQAHQSSTLEPRTTANKAVDGNRDVNYMHWSCTHTKKEPCPWFVVDLLRNYPVSHVKITNRGNHGDCCENIPCKHTFLWISNEAWTKIHPFFQDSVFGLLLQTRDWGTSL